MSDDVFETPSSTPNFQTELAEKLADLVPEAIADGKIDVLKLQELLADDAAETTERFGLFWPGKQRALQVAQLPTTATLRPEPEKSKYWDTTQNVFIEGENLEVLKLLQKQYHGKIKMIYIDPPYNTGKDFVYPDNYKEGLENYLEWTRQVNEEGKKISTNSETEGRYHSNWLTMMYPRLKLARNLLSQDGVIFISIDDSEYDNLKKLCNEIFGEQNFIGNIVWQKKQSPQNDAMYLSAMHDYVLVYARRVKSEKQDEAGFEINKLARSENQESNFKNPDSDPRGNWISVDLSSNKNASERPNLFYPVVNPRTGREIWPSRERVWRYERTSMQALVDDGRIWFGSNDDSFPRQKRFRSEIADGVTPSTWWSRDFAGDNQRAKRELRKLFPDFDPFSTPKPVSLIDRMLELATKPDTFDLVLDFFGGSGTTAQAVMERNAADNGNRRFILVQLPEPTGNDTEQGLAGFTNLADICRERLERAGAQLQAKEASLIAAKPIDVGFRTYKLSQSGFSKWTVLSDAAQSTLEQHLFDIRDNAQDSAQQEDLLVEILIKQGFGLSEQIQERKIADLQVYSVGDGLVLAYVNEVVKPRLESLREVIEEKPSKLIVLEDAFHGDDELKTNLAQLCKSKNIELWTA